MRKGSSPEITSSQLAIYSYFEIVGILFSCFLITRCLKIVNVNGLVNIKVASKAEELKPALFHVRP